MKRRMIALLLIAAALIGCLTACGKGQDSTEPGQTAQNGSDTKTNAQVKRMDAETVTSKYAYSAEYIDLPVEVDYVNESCVSGNSFFFIANVKSGTESYTDPDSGQSYEYDTYDNKLFKMDLSTRECTELDALLAIEPAEESDDGWMRDSYVQSMTASPDGGVWLYMQVNSYRFNTPEGEDQSQINYDYYESGETKNTLIAVGADGEVRLTLDVDAADTDLNDSFYISDFFVDSNGYVYAGDWQTVRIWDKDGKYIGAVSMGDYSGNLMQYNADKIGVVTYGQDHAFKVIDPVKLDFGESIPLPANAYQLYPGDDVYDFFYENNGKIYGYITETQTSEKVVDWMECDVDSNNMSTFSVLPDGRVFAMTQDYRNGGSEVQFILLTRVDASTLPEKTTLTLACMYLDYNLRSQIVKFNRQNQQYRIVVKDYSEFNTDDDYSAGLTKLTTELSSGAMPDMLLTTSLPVQQYAAKGLLVDLEPLLEADSTLSREDLITELLDAMSTDGKLYQMPTSFQLSSVAGLEKVVGGYDTWTLDDVKDAMTKLQPDATIFSKYYTKENVLSACINTSFDTFVDWENGTCNFDSDEFKGLLEFANEFPEEYDYSADSGEEYESDYSRMKSGKQLLTTMSFYGFDELYAQFKMMDDQPCFVGFPTTASGERVRSFFSPDTSIAITAACADTDAAWAFIRSALSEEYQSQLWDLPVLKSAFDAKLAEAMKQEFYTDENGNQVEQSKGGIGYGNDEMIEIYAVTEEQKNIFMDLLHSTTKVNTYDENIMNIITEETGSYFGGQKTADEVAKIIQNRVNLYVAEQR